MAAGGATSWQSQKQKSVALSTVEAEYMAACAAFQGRSMATRQPDGQSSALEAHRCPLSPHSASGGQAHHPPRLRYHHEPSHSVKCSVTAVWLPWVFVLHPHRTAPPPIKALHPAVVGGVLE